jgi:hypothetical protein
MSLNQDFSPLLDKYEGKIWELYTQLVDIEAQHEIKVSTWIFNIESISDPKYINHCQ